MVLLPLVTKLPMAYFSLSIRPCSSRGRNGPNTTVDAFYNDVSILDRHWEILRTEALNTVRVEIMTALENGPRTELQPPE